LRLAARLTLVAFLIHPPAPWQIRLPLLVLAGLGLLWPRSLLVPALWFGLAAVSAARVVLDWPLADNHAYLASAWCLAVALAGWTSVPGIALARSARALLVLVFALAVLWKGVLSPDYRDGTFFRVTALVDARFEPAAHWLGGMSPNTRRSNRDAILEAIHSPNGQAPELDVLPRFDRFVTAATWWTLLVEAAIALCFAFPAVPAAVRHALLVGFCATTFAVAPVPGFGWLLAALGLAQLGERQTGWQAAYLAASGCILLQDVVSWHAQFSGPAG
jgi:hypothetical protein